MNALLSALLLIFVSLSSSELSSIADRSKRAAIQPFQPLVGATTPSAVAVNSSSINTDDPVGMGVHSGAVKAAIMIAGVVALGVLLAVFFAWYFMPKDDPAERSPLLRGGKVDSRCHSHA